MIILTYHELDNFVTNKNNITTKWLTPTTYKHYPNCFEDMFYGYIEDDYPDLEKEKENLSFLFLIGKNHQININDIFEKLNKVLI